MVSPPIPDPMTRSSKSVTRALYTGHSPGQHSPSERHSPAWRLRHDAFQMDEWFRRFSHATAEIVGRSRSFMVAVLVIAVWAVTGPVFHFSDTWQLVINTGTTIVTFLMVFLIQNSQNREGEALQAKLDELIRALDAAENRFIGLEQHSEKEIGEMRSEIESSVTQSTVSS